MKRVSLVIMLAVLATFGFGVGCKSGAGGDNAKMIVKKWKVTDISSPEIDTMSAETKTQMKAAMTSLTMDFGADGTCTASMSGMGESKAKYKVEGNTMTTTDSTGKESKATIVELSDSKFVAEVDQEGHKMKMIMEPAK